jgi:hypothetical protein
VKVHRIYYAHPKALYGTDAEKRNLKLIRSVFPEGRILNPRRYQYFPYSRSIMSHYRDLVDNCDIVVFSRLRRRVTAGVGKEVNHALRKGLPVYEIKRHRIAEVHKRVKHLNVRETRKLMRRYYPRIETVPRRPLVVHVTPAIASK